MRQRPIKRLTVNGIKITASSNWEELYNKDKAAWYAYTLFINSAYPKYLKTEVEQRYGKQNFIIEVNNHIKYKKEQKENPEAFS